MTSKERLLKRSRFLGIGSALIVAMWLATATVGSAQTFKTLVNFDGADGQYPFTSLVQGRDGNFYGTTSWGTGPGTVFKITPGGDLTTLYTFCSQPTCTDGDQPWVGLVLGTDGNFYGTTFYGGADPNGGTVFKITPGGRLTTLYSFCSQTNCAAGHYPWAGLVQASDGNFYGTTYDDPTNSGLGTVFKITPEGSLTTLHTFTGPDGLWVESGLIQATDGNLYGTASGGGAYGDGTVFRITLGGALTTLHSFNYADGAYPSAALIQAADGSFYGTTEQGGANGRPGTVFKITPTGKLTTLHSFNISDGAYTYAGLIQASDGNFYGATTGGGVDPSDCSWGAGCGTVFQITPAGTLTTLHSFQGTDGDYPMQALLQATNGKFYGTAAGRAACCFGIGDGTVFSLDMGLGPFVTFVRSYGKAGQRAEILGQGFGGTTGVSFNGTAATFTVYGGTFLVATVPAGATTGPVTVTTSRRTLTSNVPFRVMP